MTLKEFKIHKTQWWNNMNARLSGLIEMIQKSSYTSYQTTAQEMLDKNIAYVNTFIDKRFFYIDMSNIKIVESGNDSFKEPLLKVLKQSLESIEQHIKWLVKNVGTLSECKIQDAQFIIYKTDFENNQRYALLNKDLSNEQIQNLQKNTQHFEIIDENLKVIFND